jgi:hypothetical protein
MIDNLIGPVMGLLDKIIPDPTEKARLAHEIATLAERQAHEIAKSQIEVNRTEAASSSMFVAGWRPAVGWICAIGLGFNFICVPLGNFVLTVNGSALIIPALNVSEMMPVLMGMLGLGAYRTFEKTRGVSREK